MSGSTMNNFGDLGERQSWELPRISNEKKKNTRKPFAKEEEEVERIFHFSPASYQL